MVRVGRRPLISAHARCVNLSLASETVLEFMGATDEISVHVRLEDVADVKLVFATILNEIIHVSRGVENCRFSCALVSDHVGRNGQSWNESLVKQHCSIAASAHPLYKTTVGKRLPVSVDVVFHELHQVRRVTLKTHLLGFLQALLPGHPGFDGCVHHDKGTGALSSPTVCKEGSGELGYLLAKLVHLLRAHVFRGNRYVEVLDAQFADLPSFLFRGKRLLHFARGAEIHHGLESFLRQLLKLFFSGLSANTHWSLILIRSFI